MPDPGRGRGRACPDAHPDAAKLLLPALNAMIDMTTTTRTLATHMHPPLPIFAMLFVLALAGALLAGHGMAAEHGTQLAPHR